MHPLDVQKAKKASASVGLPPDPRYRLALPRSPWPIHFLTPSGAYVHTYDRLRVSNWTGWHGRHTISFTRQVQTKLNFKLLHAFDPQNTGQVETKVLLTMFNRISAASFE